MQEKEPTQPRSAQDAFNRVWQVFVVEKAPKAVDSTSPSLSSCAYRKEGTQGCAIGCQLPDRLCPPLLVKMNPSMRAVMALCRDDASAFALAKDSRPPETVAEMQETKLNIRLWFSFVPAELLCELQIAHDNTFLADFHNEIELNLRAIAARWTLQIPGEGE